MSDKEKNELERPHIVDGIKEYDNPLPNWWISLFVMCMVFAFVYMVQIHGGEGPLLEEELTSDLAAMEAKENEVLNPSNESGEGGDAPGSSDENFIAVLNDPEALASGKVSYETYCSPCHKNDMGGLIGPNLTDDTWIHGCTPDAIIATIDQGVPAKGMVAWGPILGRKKVVEVAAYIVSKKGSNPPNAKASQGERCVWTP